MMRDHFATRGQSIQADLLAALVMVLLIGCACLAGIWTGGETLLASVWPANAVLLGLLLRWPPASRPLSLLAAVAGFFAADLLHGSTLSHTAALTAANLSSVLIAWLLLSQLPAGVRRLRYPVSLLWITVAAGLGGLAAATVGNLLLPPRPGGWVMNLLMWAVTETANYLSFLPVLLSAPWPGAMQGGPGRRRLWRRRDLLPAASLVLSCALALAIGGPGAVAVPVLALLWCGMVYSVFITSLLTLIFGTLALGVITLPLLSGGETEQRDALLSLRIGIAMVALMPVMLAVITRSRDRLTARLSYLASHDGLTGIQNRGSFMDRARMILEDERRPAAMLVLDVDRFKQVNDTWGHSAGDVVLVETVWRIAALLRASDQFARLGGEEFGVLMTDCTLPDALAVAERLRLAVSSTPVRLSQGCYIPVTISIGVVPLDPAARPDLALVMALADRCMYSAKAAGRNRVMVYTGQGGPQAANLAGDAGSRMPQILHRPAS